VIDLQRELRKWIERRSLISAELKRTEAAHIREGLELQLTAASRHIHRVRQLQFHLVRVA
jgi:hypothetical protein